MGQSIEVLTVEEFADRMKISRATVFDWMQRGKLKAGRHYIHIGRVIRFEWGPELLQRLHEDCRASENPPEPVNRPPKPAIKKVTPRQLRKGTAINWDA